MRNLKRADKATEYSSLQIASPLRELACHTNYGIAQCYLPPGSGDIPAFAPAKLVLDLATAEGC